MARKVGLFRTFKSKRYTREGIRSNKAEADELATKLKGRGYKVRIIKVSSYIHTKGFAYAVYARR